MDYQGKPYGNSSTPGLISDSVSQCVIYFLCQFVYLIPQIMHQLMVKPLPLKCRLTAIFDVSQTNEMIQHTSTLMIFCSLVIVLVFLVRRLLSVVLNLLILTIVFKVFHILYASSRLLWVALTHSTQYDSNGLAKPLRHPEPLEILRQKSSYADVVSTVLSGGRLPPATSL